MLTCDREYTFGCCTAYIIKFFFYDMVPKLMPREDFDHRENREQVHGEVHGTIMVGFQSRS